MRRVRDFFSHLSREIEFALFSQRLITGLGINLFTVSMINIAGLLYETSATKSIVFAKDNDAGRGIQTATITRWWKSNHFASFGNVYFRLAPTFAELSPSAVNKLSQKAIKTLCSKNSHAGNYGPLIS